MFARICFQWIELNWKDSYLNKLHIEKSQIKYGIIIIIFIIRGGSGGQVSKFPINLKVTGDWIVRVQIYIFLSTWIDCFLIPQSISTAEMWIFIRNIQIKREKREWKSNNVDESWFFFLLDLRCEQLRFELAIFRYIHPIGKGASVCIWCDCLCCCCCYFCWCGCCCCCWFLAFTLYFVKIRPVCKQKATSKELYDMKKRSECAMGYGTQRAKRRQYDGFIGKKREEKKKSWKTKGQTYQIRTRPNQTKQIKYYLK